MKGKMNSILKGRLERLLEQGVGSLNDARCAELIATGASSWEEVDACLKEILLERILGDHSGESFGPRALKNLLLRVIQAIPDEEGEADSLMEEEEEEEEEEDEDLEGFVVSDEEEEEEEERFPRKRRNRD